MLKTEFANLADFDRTSMDNRAFFVNLYQLMEKIQPNSSKCTHYLPKPPPLTQLPLLPPVLFTHCLCLLEQCAGNEDLRKDMVERFKYQTVLATYVNKINERKTIRRILRLLNELTYGIQITWSEPYLTTLVHRLFEIIGYREEANESAALALSVLVNLAYKNPPVIEIFYSTINTQFLKSIQSLGVLTNKMYYILGQNSPKDLLASVHLYFKEIDRTHRSQSVSDLGRTVDFALDVFRRENEFMRTNKGLINEHLDTLLEGLGALDSQKTAAAGVELRCLAKILEFFFGLIELGEILF